MKINMLLKLYFLAAVLLSVTVVSCSDDDKESITKITPEVTHIELNKLGLTAVGDTALLNIESNKYWTARIESEGDWLTSNIYGGSGDVELKLTALRNEGNASRTAAIKFEALDGTIETVSVVQAGADQQLYYFSENCDGDLVTSKLPVNSYSAWSTGGVSGAGLRLLGEGVYVDNANPSSGYTGASGGNNLFLGQIEDDLSARVSLYTSAIGTKSNKAFTLSFATSSDASTFDTSKFKVYISKDNTYWSELSYNRSSSSAWEKSEIKFYFDDPHQYLYFRFTALEPNTFRVDDITLSENEYGVGDFEDFVVVIDDENPAGFVYFEENFAWTKVESLPTNPNTGLSKPYIIPMVTTTKEEIRLDYDNTKAFQYYPGLYEAKENSGWTVSSSANRVYVSWECFKSGTTAAASDGILISPKFSKITKGALVNLKVTFRASIYKNDTGSTDPTSHITVSVPEGSPGTIDNTIATSKIFVLTQWPPDSDEFTFTIYGATNDTRLYFRSPNKGEDFNGQIVGTQNKRCYYRYFKVEKAN